MTANGRNTANVGSGDVEISGRGGVLIGVAVLITNAAGVLELREVNVTGRVLATIQADVGGFFIPMNVTFKTALFADIAGTTARYIVVYD